VNFWQNSLIDAGLTLLEAVKMNTPVAVEISY